MDSILSSERKCYICGSTCFLESHHIFGAYNRKNSEIFGLKVYLCHNCHNEPPNGVHHNAYNDTILKEIGQRAFENKYPALSFIKIFGRNYL